MVTLNATLFVQLVLFLMFLWGTARFILRPVLETLDEREATIAQDTEQAEIGSTEADKLEAGYLGSLTDLHRQADDTYRAAHRSIMQAYLERLDTERAKADKTVLTTRENLQEVVEKERPAIEAAIPGVAELIAQRLKPGGAQ